MASRDRRRKGGRATPKGTRPASSGQGGIRDDPWGPQEPELMADVRRRLATGQPLMLLGEVAGLVAAADPRSRSPFERDRDEEEPEVTLDELIAAFVDVDRPETSALLAGLAELAPDEIQRARARRAAAGRSHVLPDWLVGLGRAEAYGCTEMVHVLGDGDNVMIGLRLAGGHELTVVVYIDHNVGTLVKDAFVIGEPIDSVISLMKEHSDRPEDLQDTQWLPLAPADARVRVSEAIERAAMTYPRFETETWPVCRPIVEWATRLLPLGGRGYVRPEWDDAAKQHLTDEFFASSFAAGLDSSDHRSLLESILWFGTDYGPGDPLRWSPVAVEIILDDWIPRKIVAPAEYLSDAPELLRAFIRFSHHERGIRARLTEETLDAVDRSEPGYQMVIRSDRPQGPAALLAAMGAFDRDDWDDDWDDDDWDEDDDFVAYDHEAARREDLQRMAGGATALAALDDRPLPDEQFQWDGIDDDIRGRVAEILAMTDRCCDELLDTEYRTACRRLLARAAASGPNAFRRSARSDIAAAAICWIIGRSNELFSPTIGRMTAKQLSSHFGLGPSGGSQRAPTLLRAAGIEVRFGHDTVGGYVVGAPELLVSSWRRRLIAMRSSLRP